MITRRTLVFSSLFAAGLAPAAHAQAASSPHDPVGILNAIYTRAAKGKGDGGGTFVIDGKAARAKYLSKSLVALWAKADAHTHKGDVGPVEFDPVTNSQDPDLKSFTVAPEKLEADHATIAVTLIGHRQDDRKPGDEVVRHEMVREGAAWKIDDIKGSADGEAWSVRALLVDSFKY